MHLWGSKHQSNSKTSTKVTGLNISTEYQTFSQLYLTKGALQRTQLSDMKLKKFFIIYQHLKGILTQI